MSIVSVKCVVCDTVFSYEKLRAGRLRRCCSDQCKDIRSRRSLKSRACLTCAQPFFPPYLSRDSAMRGFGAYCSLSCRPQVVLARRYEDRAERRRASEHRRRAALKAAVSERFSPTEVFQRDRWICALCGEPVDKSLRFPEPMSASLDHRVPLALGGDHTRANTQCSHWLCNSRKSFGIGENPRQFWADGG